MKTMRPVVYLLCGLGGSGKSTYAQKLEKDGLKKLSLDEEVYKRHGRDIVHLPEQEYLRLYRETKKDLDERLVKFLKQGKSMVLDYGFWRRASRDEYKRLIESNGGEWRLVYLKGSPEVLMKRLRKRNERIDANAFPVTEEMFRKFLARFEEPKDEGEEIIEQH